jgi:hypothetical protein
VDGSEVRAQRAGAPAPAAGSLRHGVSRRVWR